MYTRHVRKRRWTRQASIQAGQGALLHQISTRLARFLIQAGVLEQDRENSYLNLEHLDAHPLRQVHGHSITYRIAVGPQQGRKVFTLQTVLPREEDNRFSQVAKAGGFSLHAGVSVQAHQHSKLERLCRYVAQEIFHFITQAVVITISTVTSATPVELQRSEF